MSLFVIKSTLKIISKNLLYGNIKIYPPIFKSLSFIICRLSLFCSKSLRNFKCCQCENTAHRDKIFCSINYICTLFTDEEKLLLLVTTRYKLKMLIREPTKYKKKCSFYIQTIMSVIINISQCC